MDATRKGADNNWSLASVSGSNNREDGPDAQQVEAPGRRAHRAIAEEDLFGDSDTEARFYSLLGLSMFFIEALVCINDGNPTTKAEH